MIPLFTPVSPCFVGLTIPASFSENQGLGFPYKRMSLASPSERRLRLDFLVTVHLNL